MCVYVCVFVLPDVAGGLLITVDKWWLDFTKEEDEGDPSCLLEVWTAKEY